MARIDWRHWIVIAVTVLLVAGLFYILIWPR